MTGDFRPFSIDNNSEVRRLEAALTAAGVGTWQIDLATREFLLCERFNILFGNELDPNTTLEHVLSQIHVDDRATVKEKITETLTSRFEKVLDIEFRTLEKTQTPVRWISLKGQLEFDAEGLPYRLSGAALDVTQRVMLAKSSDNAHSHFKTIVEQAPMAIGLLTGQDMVIDIANDRVIEAWGKDRSVIGKKLIDALPEIRDQGFIELLRHVYDTGEPFFGNEHLAKMERNGQLEEGFFDFIYAALRSSGSISGIMIMAHEVTEKVRSTKNLEGSEARFRSLIEEAPVSTCLFVGRDMRIEVANEIAIKNWGKGRSVIGRPLAEALPELKSQDIFDILDDVFTTGQPFEGKGVPIYLQKNGIAQTNFYDFTFKPLLNADGEVYAVLDMAFDVTDKILAQKALEESEAKLRSVIVNAPVAIGLFVGRDLVVEMPNQTFIDIVGKGTDIVGKPLRDVMPELESQPFLKILDDVFTSGQPYQSAGIQVNIVRDGVMTHNFYNITYSPLFDQQDNVYAILDIAIDVTDKMREQQMIEESQIALLDLFEQSTVAIAVISGPDLIFTMTNTFYANLVGRTVKELVGKPLLEAIPEIYGQGFDLLLANVMTTGRPYVSHEQPVQILHDGQPVTIYVDLNYQPRRAKDNTIIGVLVVANDVTLQVLARKDIQEAESTLRAAVELAELGAWKIDLRTGDLYFSQRLRSWFGLESREEITFEKIYSAITQKDLSLVQDAVRQALENVETATYDVEFEMESRPAGMTRILHAVGSVVYNAKGEAIKVSGNVHDVTLQRELQRSLEYQVQNRTEELEATNEELAAINEQFTLTNEELAKTNQMLVRSNENLQRFAYVASHDLQEPLRKIQSFGDLLRNRFPEDLGGGAEYVHRMQAAAKRMSALIEDLLTFSRVSEKENTALVYLNEVVATALSDLELVVQQTRAVITVDPLPNIYGDRMQLGQLFQNLISNALKFIREDTTPVISITCQIKAASQLPAHVKPSQTSEGYYQINVSDNGIGFDNKYVDRIFQIFQRLHGKTEFVGTGIGLAICEKVAASHGGAITAASELGKGSVFTIYLPV